MNQINGCECFYCMYVCCLWHRYIHFIPFNFNLNHRASSASSSSTSSLSLTSLSSSYTAHIPNEAHSVYSLMALLANKIDGVENRVALIHMLHTHTHVPRGHHTQTKTHLLRWAEGETLAPSSSSVMSMSFAHISATRRRANELPEKRAHNPLGREVNFIIKIMK